MRITLACRRIIPALPSGYVFIGMLDDIRGGFIGGKLDVIHILIAKTTFTRNLTHKLADLIQIFKFRGKLNSLAYGKLKAASAHTTLKAASFHNDYNAYSSLDRQKPRNDPQPEEDHQRS